MDHEDQKMYKVEIYHSRAPWLGGQCERMFSLLKNTLYKTVGKSKLEWKELEEVLTDIETT